MSIIIQETNLKITELKYYQIKSNPYINKKMLNVSDYTNDKALSYELENDLLKSRWVLSILRVSNEYVWINVMKVYSISNKHRGTATALSWIKMMENKQ